MCFTKRRQQSRLTKQNFSRLHSQRLDYCQNNEISQYFRSILEFMQLTLKKPEIARHHQVKILNKNYHHNVHAKLQKAFYDLSTKEQLIYYQIIVETLINKTMVDYEKLNDPEMNFQFQIEEQTILSKKTSILKFSGERLSLIADDMTFDFRNFWLRKTATNKPHTWVMMAIGGEPKTSKFKFTVDENEENSRKIGQKLKLVAREALVSSVNEWVKPKTKIESKIDNQFVKLAKTLSYNQVLPKITSEQEELQKKSSQKEKPISNINDIEFSSIREIPNGTNSNSTQKPLINYKPLFEGPKRASQSNRNSEQKQTNRKNVMLLPDLLEISEYHCNRNSKNETQQNQHEMDSQYSLQEFGNVEGTTNSQQTDQYSGSKATTSFYSMGQERI